MWFTEDAWTPMALLAIGALVCLGLWNTSRRNGYLLVAAVFALGCGATWVIESSVVTDREQLEALVQNLCDDFRRKAPRTLDYFSARSEPLRVMAASAMALVDVQDDLRVTDFETELTNENTRGSVHFRANATLSVGGFGNVGRQPVRAIIDWQREGGAWKIVEIRRLNPLNGQEMPVMSQSTN
ncbi:hypothetical protein [Planctellipticum variicoloris]|uniref:hypothetical protein n=1 Tax=Planctellipticum variicoloris TaxID=3064265 RepID=UPI00301322A4|nr:hypothetical protein SH412_005455 [Planctomycetaceae bacterium SH412]